MTRAFDKLKIALNDVGITSPIDVPGTPRIPLYLVGSAIAVAFRTDAEVGHRWRLWLGPDPVGPEADPRAWLPEICFHLCRLPDRLAVRALPSTG